MNTVIEPLIPAEIIRKKRDGGALSLKEIRSFVSGVVTGEVADYQASAFLMAVFLNGMDSRETASLTKAMIESGELYDLASVPGPKVDKHSTGGVGDKVSLILAPLAAACGLKVPMMSGRGLGHSGGTLDKLESIFGFNVKLSFEAFLTQLREIGCAMIGQTESIAPADRKLYALRDITATVESIPLIVASILSKKIAEGAEALVFDIKVGNGAFMKTRREALDLSHALIKAARANGLRASAMLTDMSQPLGYAVGNALEVREAIEVLRCEKAPNGLQSNDLTLLTLRLTAEMLRLGKLVKTLAQGEKLAFEKLHDGSAWSVFERMVAAQGGSLEAIHNPQKLPQATIVTELVAPQSGFVHEMDTENIGKTLVALGGGRKKSSDRVDPSVGMVFHHKIGSRVVRGDPLVTIHASSTSSSRLALEALRTSIIIKKSKCRPKQLIF